jgi:hypothetical protein
LLKKNIFFLIGIFKTDGLLSFAFMGNSTFKDIIALNKQSRGSVIDCNFANNLAVLTIDCCIFIRCVGGSTVLVAGDSSYLYITRSRFENNSALNGNDIWIFNFKNCLNKGLADSLASSTCSTSSPKNKRIYCYDGFDTSQLQNDCSDDIVLIF